MRIGTRGSLLAKWQAEHVRKLLFQAAGVEAEIIVIKTSGDKLAQAPLTQIGGKGIFIKELEEALIAGSVDLAVHSVKDVPTETPSRLFFPAVLRREDVRDCIVSRAGGGLSSLREGARVGTSSLRRQAQLRRMRRDLDLRDLRGNVDTRLRKVESGEYEAVVLAKAGLDRLGLGHRISEILSPEVCLPAVGQGAITIEARTTDSEISDVIGKLNDLETRNAVVAERSLLAELQGGCQVPLGAWAHMERGELILEACVASIDGAEYVRERAGASPEQAAELGREVAQRLLNSGAGQILEQVGRQRG
jgi:hydroxymethylbilane synthase